MLVKLNEIFWLINNKPVTQWGVNYSQIHWCYLILESKTPCSSFNIIAPNYSTFKKNQCILCFCSLAISSLYQVDIIWFLVSLLISVSFLLFLPLCIPGNLIVTGADDLVPPLWCVFLSKTVPRLFSCCTSLFWSLHTQWPSK